MELEDMYWMYKIMQFCMIGRCKIKHELVLY